MKFIHLSDLHIGKRVNEYSMLEDQQYILVKILDVIKEEKPDGVIIAGDVYDKAVPSAEAVSLFDDFLFALSKLKCELFIISGNHDSPERIAFGGRILGAVGVHVSPVYNGSVEHVTISDAYGNVNVYMLPFVKPVTVRRFFEETEISTYSDAVKAALSNADVNTDERNVLIAHQLVSGAVASGSEELSVGGIENVDASVLGEFDYVALGHIHRPQKAGGEHIRYCGSPLKYSFSEVGHEKSVTVLELFEKGNTCIRTIPLIPKRDMREIRGTYGELMKKSFYDGTSYTDDYLRITLTDEDDIPDAASKLRVVYKNLMKLDYDNTRTRHTAEVGGVLGAESKTPLELFSDLYELQNGVPLTDSQVKIVNGIIEDLTGGEK